MKRRLHLIYHRLTSELVAILVGVFLTVGLGPRVPVGDFSNTTDLGYGIVADISYTDSDHFPFFIFARLGFEQYPGSQDFYISSDYSNFSTMITSKTREN